MKTGPLHRCCLYFFIDACHQLTMLENRSMAQTPCALPTPRAQTGTTPPFQGTIHTTYSARPAPLARTGTLRSSLVRTAAAALSHPVARALRVRLQATLGQRAASRARAAQPTTVGYASLHKKMMLEQAASQLLVQHALPLPMHSASCAPQSASR